MLHVLWHFHYLGSFKLPIWVRGLVSRFLGLRTFSQPQCRSNKKPCIPSTLSHPALSPDLTVLEPWILQPRILCRSGAGRTAFRKQGITRDAAFESALKGDAEQLSLPEFQAYASGLTADLTQDVSCGERIVES